MATNLVSDTSTSHDVDDESSERLSEAAGRENSDDASTSGEEDDEQEEEEEEEGSVPRTEEQEDQNDHTATTTSTTTAHSPKRSNRLGIRLQHRHEKKRIRWAENPDMDEKIVEALEYALKTDTTISYKEIIAFDPKFWASKGVSASNVGIHLRDLRLNRKHSAIFNAMDRTTRIRLWARIRGRGSAKSMVSLPDWLKEKQPTMEPHDLPFGIPRKRSSSEIDASLCATPAMSMLLNMPNYSQHSRDLAGIATTSSKHRRLNHHHHGTGSRRTGILQAAPIDNRNACVTPSPRGGSGGVTFSNGHGMAPSVRAWPQAHDHGMMSTSEFQQLPPQFHRRSDRQGDAASEAYPADMGHCAEDAGERRSRTFDMMLANNTSWYDSSSSLQAPPGPHLDAIPPSVFEYGYEYGGGGVSSSAPRGRRIMADAGPPLKGGSSSSSLDVNLPSFPSPSPLISSYHHPPSYYYPLPHQHQQHRQAPLGDGGMSHAPSHHFGGSYHSMDPHHQHHPASYQTYLPIVLQVAPPPAPLPPFNPVLPHHFGGLVRDGGRQRVSEKEKKLHRGSTQTTAPDDRATSKVY